MGAFVFNSMQLSAPIGAPYRLIRKVANVQFHVRSATLVVAARLKLRQQGLACKAHGKFLRRAEHVLLTWLLEVRENARQSTALSDQSVQALPSERPSVWASLPESELRKLIASLTWADTDEDTDPQAVTGQVHCLCGKSCQGFHPQTAEIERNIYHPSTVPLVGESRVATIKSGASH